MYGIYDETFLIDIQLNIESNDLKLLSILTKEQFASIEYKVEG